MVRVNGTDLNPAWLEPTWFIDADHEAVAAFAAEAVGDATDPEAKAVQLFHAVRDGFRYDPYDIEHEPEQYKASAITSADRGWCVSKSVLLTAAARNQGIPARLGFADVRNHLSTPKLLESLGTDLFIWHGYSELLLEGRWFKLSTAFNIELCERFGVKVLEFDGTHDALMHPFDASGNRHMEYINQRGSYDDLPLDAIMADFASLYRNWGAAGASTAAEAGDDAWT